MDAKLGDECPKIYCLDNQIAILSKFWKLQLVRAQNIGAIYLFSNLCWQAHLRVKF